jgi:hypothetical protein
MYGPFPVLRPSPDILYNLCLLPSFLKRPREVRSITSAIRQPWFATVSTLSSSPSSPPKHYSPGSSPHLPAHSNPWQYTAPLSGSLPRIQLSSQKSLQTARGCHITRSRSRRMPSASGSVLYQYRRRVCLSIFACARRRRVSWWCRLLG